MREKNDPPGLELIQALCGPSRSIDKAKPAENCFPKSGPLGVFSARPKRQKTPSSGHSMVTLWHVTGLTGRTSRSFARRDDYTML